MLSCENNIVYQPLQLLYKAFAQNRLIQITHFVAVPKRALYYLGAIADIRDLVLDSSETFCDVVIQSAFPISKSKATSEGLLGKANMCLEVFSCYVLPVSTCNCYGSN